MLGANGWLLWLLVSRRGGLEWRSTTFVAALTASDFGGGLVLAGMTGAMVTSVLLCVKEARGIPVLITLVMECEMTASMTVTTLTLLLSSLAQLYAITQPIQYQVSKIPMLGCQRSLICSLPDCFHKAKASFDHCRDVRDRDTLLQSQTRHPDALSRTAV